MNSSLGIQIGSLARRSISRTFRQPAIIVPTLVFPLLFLAVFGSGLNATASLPGFPARTYLDFAFAIPFMMGALSAGVVTATDLANDVETGFLNRLLVTPTRSGAILIGHLIGVVVAATIQVAVFIVVGLIVGVEVAAGFTGVLVLVIYVVLLAVGIGGVASMVALRTGSGEAVQGLFPVFFALSFLSSLIIPRQLIEADWFRTIANVNPTSYVIEGIRSLIITGWDAQAMLLGFAVLAGLLALGLGGATMALRVKVVRS